MLKSRSLGAKENTNKSLVELRYLQVKAEAKNKFLNQQRILIFFSFRPRSLLNFAFKR